MPTLDTDIIGRVKRLALRPSATAALLPMFEAVSNGLHAIDDRHGPQAKDQGRLDIEVLREGESTQDSPVTGFVITDNGVGLNDINYRSFQRPDSQYKIQRGGKGVGRLGWLKVFNDIRVDSTYFDGDSHLKIRAFDFLLRDDEQVSERSGTSPISQQPGTRVTLKSFDSIYSNKCPVSPVVIRQRIIGHFMQILAADIAPSISVLDGDEITDLRVAFSALVKDSVEQVVAFDIGEVNAISVSLTVRHIRASKAIRPDSNKKNYNWLFLSGNQRAVEESPIDDAIGLKALAGEEVYVGCVYGDYLDNHVNQLRTAFDFSADDSRTIRRALVESIMHYLHTYVTEVKNKKKQIARKVIGEYPQFLYLQSEMQDFIEGLAPGAVSKEAVFVEMCRDRFRKTNQAHKVENAIQAAPIYNTEVQTQMEQYRAFIEGQQKGVLAEYVLLRKSIIDILDKYAGFQDDTDTNYLEDAIHKLIVPMRTDSSRLKITDHNLWLVDDRLAFYGFFASDKLLKSFTSSDSKDRADIAFFYETCFAWEQDDATNSVALVEFKRPGRDNYDGRDNPLRQLIGYISSFKSSTSLRDAEGKIFSPRLQQATFHCYIIADLTNTLREALSGYPFSETPDKLGMIGYIRNPDAFVEVVSYNKLLQDSKKRNAIFFKHLGLTDIEPTNSDYAVDAEASFTTNDTNTDE